MSELFDEMWPAFEAEVGEQLDNLEQLLVRQDGTDIDAVFRQFHTIKSTSAMMGFHDMEAVAHAAEDLLALLRRQEVAFDGNCRDTLLRAVDTLRRQLGEALATRMPPAGDAPLVAALRALAQTAPGAVARALPGGGNDRATGDDNLDSGLDDKRNDSSSLLAYLAFSEQVFPQLVLAAAEGRALPAGTARLATLAGDSGLQAIVRVLQRLQNAAMTRRLPVLAELVMRQRHVESLAGHDAGTRAAGDSVRAACGHLVSEPLADAAHCLRDQPLTTAQAATAWLSPLEQLLLAAQLAGLPATEKLLQLARQCLREIERETREPSAALADCLALAMTLPAELAPDQGEDAPYVDLAEQLLKNLQAALHAVAGDAPAAGPALPALPALAALDASWLAGMAADKHALLVQALQQGHTLVDIDADLEALPDNGEAFIDWLASEGNLLGSHTVFTGNGDSAGTRLRFLATLPMAPADIRLALAAQAEDDNVFRLHMPGSVDAGEANDSTANGNPPATPAHGRKDTNHATADAAVTAAAGSQTLRVESRTLDTFVNRLGELVMLRNMMAHTLVDNDAQHGLQRLRELVAGLPGVDRREREQLNALISHLDQRQQRLLDADSRLQGTLNRLQEDVMSLRVVPVGVVFNRMTRVVRQVADSQGKQVRLEISGDDVRIDKSMVDLLVEPLTHMVRNAVDHGLENPAQRRALGKDDTGTLRLAARQQGNAILVTVADDGRGLDHARILAKARALGLAGDGDYSPREIADFIFAPGFSTAGTVTAVSGRGVGMDVVKTRLAQLGGQVEVQSRADGGTVFTLRLPLSVAIQAVVMVNAGGQRHALAERNVNELLLLPAGDVQKIRNQPACMLRGQTLPLYRLDDLLGRHGNTARGGSDGSDLHVLVLSDGIHRIGLVVDSIAGRQEVFVRDIHPELMRLPGVGGAAILGDGNVVVIVDTDNLLALARRNAQTLQGLLRAS